MGQAVPVVASYLLNRHQIFTAPTLNASNVLRIQPNYLITREQIDRLIHALRDVGQLISDGRFSAFLNTIMGLGSRKHLMDMLQLPARADAVVEPVGEKRGTFAFFVHPTTDTDVIEGMPGGVAAYDEQDIPRILDWSARLKK